MIMINLFTGIVCISVAMACLYGAVRGIFEFGLRQSWLLALNLFVIVICILMGIWNLSIYAQGAGL
jgi:hypothetical protein